MQDYNVSLSPVNNMRNSSNSNYQNQIYDAYDNTKDSAADDDYLKYLFQ